MSERKRPIALLLSLVPGWGHVYWGLEPLGLGIFTVVAVAGFALVNGAFLWIGSWRGVIVGASSLLLVAVTLGAWIDILRRTSPRRVVERESRRLKALREGTVAYLRGDLKAAMAIFEECVKADPFDAEALFRLGIVCSRAGLPRQANAALRKSLRYDADEKWRWEVRRERERLRLEREKGRVEAQPRVAEVVEDVTRAIPR